MARLIDIDELADYLKLKKQTIYNWLNQRKISGIKVGGFGGLTVRILIIG